MTNAIRNSIQNIPTPIRTSFLGVALASMAYIALPAIDGVPVAAAACHGSGSYFPSSSGWGYEAAQSQTCDNLGDYNGLFKDTVLDGKQVRIRTRWINGSSSYVYSGYTNAQNVNYYYSFWDNDKITNYNICRSDGVCAAQGSNWGF
ncbi:hypothetical protein [Enhygromyxa salina]|uniref:hypothetical protein n=1 Tax=Enhygromyxa salina TaxID=215803 RepID=UPI000695E347|nr:hypothetical protein [Enhygromyxa salina]